MDTHRTKRYNTLPFWLIIMQRWASTTPFCMSGAHIFAIYMHMMPLQSNCIRGHSRSVVVLFSSATYVSQAHNITHVTQLMLWDHGSAFAPMVTREAIPDDPHFPQYDELNVYEHAMTVLYGMNAYVFIVDMDEFLVLGGPPSTVHSALDHGMLGLHRPGTHLPAITPSLHIPSRLFCNRLPSTHGGPFFIFRVPNEECQCISCLCSS